MPSLTSNQWKQLVTRLSGELYTDSLHRSLYATDASIYRELPTAVVIPKGEQDLVAIMQFANKYELPVIPRAAGTSLAGQCVGSGLVVDVSQHMTEILELNVEEGWVRVQPGVIRDELNRFLAPHGLFFGPNTSTANRCMMGGMVGNNSSGSTSIRYGVTRDKILEIRTILSDGSIATFGKLSAADFEQKQKSAGLEGKLYQQIAEALSDQLMVEKINAAFPQAGIHRRNTGYALDALLDMQPFKPGGKLFNFSKLLCGSEGTLAISSELVLQLDPLPPPHQVLVCPHFQSVQEALQAVLIVMQQQPYACELMDKVVLDCTRHSRAYQHHRFFLEGDPKAVLMVELRAADEKETETQAKELIKLLRDTGLGYAYPVLNSEESQKAWELRKAGLGLLSNIEGDARPVACIEDTAVRVEDLPDYIAEFEALMDDFGQQAVYYAHAGAGELHLRPMLNLREEGDRKKLYEISLASAKLVKKYKGSLSGEHGDGRVRAPFIPLMVGEEIMQLFKNLKATWDPKGLLNPGKIVDAPPMQESLRYSQPPQAKPIETAFQFEGSLLRAAEKCNGSGDCRKLPAAGGVMCPSYHATRNERDSTRARANALREFLTHSTRDNPLSHEELYEVMELCISCKGCTGECPSNVDMASMKAEFLHQYYKDHRRPLRDYAFAYQARLNELLAIWPAAANALLRNRTMSGLMKRLLAVAPQRQLPKVHRSLRNWYARNWSAIRPEKPIAKLVLFCDEFTNILDVPVGKAAIQLLATLGYEVLLLKHTESGRAAISKGLLSYARRCAETNVRLLSPYIDADCPLVGIEPSAILSFRDEYPRLVDSAWQEKAHALASHTLTFEAFIMQEVRKGRIQVNAFTTETQSLWLHGHCHQKALDSTSHTAQVLSLPENYHVQVIQSGCCGMAGSFGYEREHYAISQQIGELQLLPAVRAVPTEGIVVAPGTSCRHQVMDATGRQALHPAEVLWEAVNN